MHGASAGRHDPVYVFENTCIFSSAENTAQSNRIGSKQAVVLMQDINGAECFRSLDV